MDQPITPQNKADVALTKTVSPAFEGNSQNSSTLLVGSEFTFRIRVEVQGERTDFAKDVVMTDNLPPALQFVSISEQPSNRGEWQAWLAYCSRVMSKNGFRRILETR
jgi:uncharacterized repeat protein (TIGR01451 family)